MWEKVERKRERVAPPRENMGISKGGESPIHAFLYPLLCYWTFELFLDLAKQDIGNVLKIVLN